MRTSGCVGSWGATDEERAASYPCDTLVPEPDDVLFRAVGVDAPAPVMFRWLCQLRLAPYSYDLIDNLGRRSPRHLVEGIDDLHVGQRIATIFELASFERDRHLTMVVRGHPVFGSVAITYRVTPAGPDRCRLVVALRVRYPRNVIGLLVRPWLPAGDLVMMRKQLRTFARLAEGTALRITAGQRASR